jgi:type II secretion system protein G
MTRRIPLIAAAAAAALALGACEESGSTGGGGGAGGGGSGTFTLRPQTLATKADLNPIAQAVEIFELDMDRFPTDDEGLDALLSADAITGGDAAKWRGPYVQREQDLHDPYGNRVEYQRSGQGFLLRSLGSDGERGGTGSMQDIELRK